MHYIGLKGPYRESEVDMELPPGDIAAGMRRDCHNGHDLYRNGAESPDAACWHTPARIKKRACRAGGHSGTAKRNTHRMRGRRNKPCSNSRDHALEWDAASGSH